MYICIIIIYISFIRYSIISGIYDMLSAIQAHDFDLFTSLASETKDTINITHDCHKNLVKNFSTLKKVIRHLEETELVDEFV